MKVTIQGNPDYGELSATLGPGEVILSESGAMSRMSSNLQLKGRIIGGFFKAMIRKMFGGESFFIAEYTAPESGGMVSFSPATPGTVMHRKMQGETFYLTPGSFLACTPGIDFRTRFFGCKAFFSGEGAFVIECTGSGDLWYTSFGGVVEKEIDGEYTVDTGHLVAWDSSLDYKIGGMGNLKSTLFSGEGLVLKFTGKGKIYLQTRTMGGMSGWIIPYLR